MYDRYLADPDSVAESWREFFADYQRSTVPTVATSVAPAAVKPVVAIDAEATPLRGAAARIVSNMNASLAVPTATSVRTVSARLLEINRTALNESLARSSGAKVSFTHFIAFAIVKGLAEIPTMNSSFVDAVDEKGTPGVRRHEHVGLGRAISWCR
jgi:2-oxoglutarate decarboxylase